MNTRFPLLSLLSIILRVVGLLVFTVGGLAFFGALVYINTTASLGSNEKYSDFIPGIISVIVSIVFAIFGIIVCVIGEIIGVAFAIEDNTRRTANLVEESITQKNTAGLSPKTNPPKYLA